MARVKLFDTDAFVRKVDVKLNVFRKKDWSNGLKKGTSHWRTFLNTCVCVCVCVYVYIFRFFKHTKLLDWI